MRICSFVVKLSVALGALDELLFYNLPFNLKINLILFHTPNQRPLPFSQIWLFYFNFFWIFFNHFWNSFSVWGFLIHLISQMRIYQICNWFRNSKWRFSLLKWILFLLDNVYLNGWNWRSSIWQLFCLVSLLMILNLCLWCQLCWRRFWLGFNVFTEGNMSLGGLFVELAEAVLALDHFNVASCLFGDDWVPFSTIHKLIWKLQSAR